ncbi:MAG: RagB/SusD family nutrient uptake outer membrane protein [Bacteroidia bacterium]|nr:RagB/SusD family nutrient uptake outer membrane protein [Bacteroidia bacterium]
MRKSYNLIIFLLLGLASFLSCKKIFLEEAPRTVTINDLINNPQDGGERLIAAVYSKLYDWNVHTFSWIGISSITSDDADKGSDLGDAGTDKNLLNGWTFDATSISFDEVWIGNYEGIGRATYALQLIPQMTIPAADKDRFIGEAKLLRAYFYWNLVRVFGGVPKIDHVLESQTDIQASSIRASASEIYAFIEEDLNDAVTKLPVTVSVSENGRVTKGAARALLAKVSLYQKKWAQAKTNCDAIISGGQYSLLSNYALIWREAGEFSSESIWEVNAIGTTPNKGIDGYFLVQAPRGAGGLGWGFNTPSQNLMDAYEPGDTRKAATIMQRGETLWDGFVVNTGASNQYYNYKSYVSKTMESFNGDDVNTNKNLRIFRFGEILLIKAEAENELNDTTASKTALNQIRVRAGLLPINAISQTILRNNIYKERRVEMAFEHDRMFDLRRTGRAAAVLQALGKPYVSPKHDLFPMPQHQIDLSAGRITQNPGY